MQAGLPVNLYIYIYIYVYTYIHIYIHMYTYVIHIMVLEYSSIVYYKPHLDILRLGDVHLDGEPRLQHRLRPGIQNGTAMRH